jgi:hypothetical protein
MEGSNFSFLLNEAKRQGIRPRCFRHGPITGSLSETMGGGGRLRTMGFEGERASGATGHGWGNAQARALRIDSGVGPRPIKTMVGLYCSDGPDPNTLFQLSQVFVQMIKFPKYKI